MNQKPSLSTYQKKAMLLTFLLTAIALGSLLWIVLSVKDANNRMENTSSAASPEIVADIYQNGKLLQSIPLSSVNESYRFQVTGENEALNEIEVHPGSIGIISASCPDKLCVHQGFISNSLLPITCLPNRLVIQIRQDTNMTEATEEIASDIITY